MTKKPSNKTVGVIGSGAWGTALALTAHRAGCKVILWTNEQEHAKQMQKNNCNDLFLPNVSLPSDFTYTANYADLKNADFYILSTPAQTVRSVLTEFTKIIGSSKPVILTSKGLEKNTCLVMSQVAQEVCPNLPIAALSGPSFAVDVAANLPTAIVIASTDIQLAESLRSYLMTRNFRLYISTDMIGIQIGGALKNVVALATGIASGLDLGDNTRAALITRGLIELQRLGTSMGGKPDTFIGLSGLGDLMLTCSSTKSRNMSLGIKLAKEASNKAHNIQTKLAEGLPTAQSIDALAKKYEISMPICEQVYAFLNGSISLKSAINKLLDRPATQE